MPPRNFNLILFAVVVSITCHLNYRRTRTAGILGEAIELIERNYVDPIDQERLVMAAMEGVVSQLDEHSSYFAVEAYESFQDSIHQEFAGIGIYVDQREEGAPVRVVTPLVGSPALRAGVLPNDLIVEVDQQDVSNMLLTEVSDRLKGTPGTEVSLVVQRERERIEMSVERATIELESVVGDHRDESNRWVYRLASEPGVAYVRLKSFGEKTVRELQRVLTELDNDFDALVVDLRGNGGGLLYAARDVSDMFLSSGQIVSTRVRGGQIEESYSATPGTLVESSKPIAILVDGNSASASEIVAACLQDNGRAVIVGTRSYGKGTVQEIMPLEYGRSALRLTVARYYRPNNKNIHRNADAGPDDEWGVTPDDGFVIPMDQDALMKLSVQWREASFPLLVGIDPPSLGQSGVDQSSDPSFQEDGESASQSTETGGADLQREVDAEAAEGNLIDDAFVATLSARAKKNIDLGPESLLNDPPLRAAVGRLLRQSGGQMDPQSESTNDSVEESASGKTVKNAA